MPRPIPLPRHALLAALVLICGAACVQKQDTIPEERPALGGIPRLGSLIAMNGAFAHPGGPFGNELPPVEGMPFSAVGTTESITKLLDGNRIIQNNTVHFWRDGQGRGRVERGFPRVFRGFQQARNIPAMATIFDPVTSEGFMLNPSGKTATPMGSFAGTVSILQPPVDAPPINAQVSTGFMTFGVGMMPPMFQGDSQTKKLGEKTIDGIRVTGTRLKHTMKANTVGNTKPIVIIAEQWFSPELGVVIESRQRSAIGSQTHYKLTQIQRSEPDPALFSVPADYTKQELGQRGFSPFGLTPLNMAPPERAPPEKAQ